MSGVIHRPERPGRLWIHSKALSIDLKMLYRLWIHSKTFTSVQPSNIPGSVPSPFGRGLG
ncbi:hypothetical protein EMIT0P395_10260 [Pseudomonas sp. IT-P395]